MPSMPSTSSTPYTSHYPIRFAHTDMAGIVYYPNFFDMFQSVVEDWFDHWLGIHYATLISERKVACTCSAPAVHRSRSASMARCGAFQRCAAKSCW
jgi:acyl-CoA thioesterase FadM